MQNVTRAGRLIVPQRDMTPGECLIHGGYPVEALPFVRADLEREPLKSGHWNNYGMIQKWLGNYDEAIRCFEKAILTGPGILMPHHNLGMCYEETGRFEEALAKYAHVCSWAPDENCMYALACCLLRERKFEQAEQFWERARLAKNSAVIVPNIKVWRGEPLEGKRILVTREGGHGDVFWLMRYLAPLKQTGAHVTYIVHRSVCSLFAGHPFMDAVLPSEDPFNVNDYDYQVPLWSLPWELRKLGFTDVPMWNGAYIHAEPLSKSKELRFGLAPYSGEQLSIYRKMRSIQPEHVEAFHGIPARWTWLCAEPAPSWCDAAITVGCDWLETARVIAGLDLVVAVDSSIFHLAGAMGKPVLLAVTQGSDWKFFRETDRTAWYPSVKMFRNSESVSFGGVVKAMVQDLHDWTTSHCVREFGGAPAADSLEVPACR